MAASVEALVRCYMGREDGFGDPQLRGTWGRVPFGFDAYDGGNILELEAGGNELACEPGGNGLECEPGGTELSVEAGGNLLQIEE